jgi:hypothetical protein
VANVALTSCPDDALRGQLVDDRWARRFSMVGQPVYRDRFIYLDAIKS